jgi:serine/threonine protein kinase/Flp pilus assembly protein TadD
MTLDDQIRDSLFRWEELRQQGQHISPEELCHDSPHLLNEIKKRIQEWNRVPGLGSTIDDAGTAAESPQSPADPNAAVLQPGPPSKGNDPHHTAPRYRPIRFHAKGGLGEVHVAEDTELHREVALKRIQSPLSRDGSSRRCFLREAEITARLEHPGIVPVHGLVHDADGQPCYAMRFIPGESLGDAIKQFYEADNSDRDPGERAVALRQLLTRFIAVCNTLAYAHSRGIIHRDLKPSNIMLGQYGETLVVDWGLAKSFAGTEIQRATGEEIIRTAPPSDGANEETRPGAVKGTPAYMSPEQAAGRVDEVGPASDIFSLGATLYAILTGQAPYSGPRAVHRADHAEFLSPRQLKKESPPALEAICLKAMSLRPADRYATALELAADLEQWLADEPVTAHKERLPARARRWARKHPGLVAGIAAAVFVGMVGLVAGTILLSKKNWDLAESNAALEVANQNERQAKDNEARERQKAEASADAERQAKNNETLERRKAEAAQQQAMDALRATADEVVEKLIGAKPALGPTEKEFLESTLKRWQTFAAQKGEGELARFVRAEGKFRVAKLRASLGQNEEARAGYEEAIAEFAQLVADFPAVPQYRQGLARSHNHLGVVLADLGKRPEAEAAYRQALAILEKVPADFPAVPQCRQEVTRIHIDLGVLLAGLGKRTEAEAAYRQALAIQKKLTADFPAVPEYRQELAISHINLGALLADLGKRTEAEVAYRQALANLDKLANDFPAQPQYRRDLARSHYNLGKELKDLVGKREEAEAAYRQALAIREKLAADFPALPLYRQELATSHGNLGTLLSDLGKRDEAEAACRQALGIREKLAADFPNVPEYRRELASSHGNLGILLEGMGKRPEAEAACRKALAIQEKLAAEFPSVPLYRQELAKSHSNLAPLLFGLGKRTEAETACRKALAIQEKLAADFPNVPEYRQDLAGSHINLGALLAGMGKRTEAEAAYGRALAVQEKLAADLPDVPEYRQKLAVSHNGLGALLAGVGKRTEAETAYRKALAIREKLVAEFAAVPQYRQDLAITYSNLGILLEDLGKRKEAEAAYRSEQVILEKLAADFPAVPRYRIDLGGSQCNLASLLRESNQLEQALPSYAKAIATLEDVLRQAKVDVRAQGLLRDAHWGRAQALDSLERHTEAATHWDKAVELSPITQRASMRLHRATSRVRTGLVDEGIQEAEELAKISHPVILYNATCVLALAADRKDETGASLSKEECAKRAIALLQQAVDKGYKDAEHMKNDHGLKVLREREDFKKLLAELEKKAP